MSSDLRHILHLSIKAVCGKACMCQILNIKKKFWALFHHDKNVGEVICHVYECSISFEGHSIPTLFCWIAQLLVEEEESKQGDIYISISLEYHRQCHILPRHETYIFKNHCLNALFLGGPKAQGASWKVAFVGKAWIMSHLVALL